LHTIDVRATVVAHFCMKVASAADRQQNLSVDYRGGCAPCHGLPCHKFVRRI